MNWKEYIVADDEILCGKPVIKGTRIAVEFLIKLFASGWTEQQIFESYPQINQTHLQAVFTFIYEDIQDKLILNSYKQVA